MLEEKGFIGKGLMKSKVEYVLKNFIGVGKKAYFYESISYEEFKE